MKLAGTTAIVVTAFLALTASASAQSPREQLTVLVAQLQKTPNDNALRERIVKLAVDIKPAPVIPDEAIRFEGRAHAAFTTATNASDYLLAAAEYRNAVGLAPWVGGYYSDLCTIYEKAGIYAEAKQNCQWALMAESDPASVVDFKRRIAGLDFFMEKFATGRLSARLDEPFSAEIPGMPAGSRYFCRAKYSPTIFRMFAGGAGDPALIGRDEYWFVYDGTRLYFVDVAWLEPESLAAWALKRGLTNPLVDADQRQPDPSVPGQFLWFGVTNHFTAQISANGQTIIWLQLRGGELSQTPEEQFRWNCARQ